MWKLTYYHHQDRCTHHSTPGDDAIMGQKQTLMPSIQVCGDCTSPVWGRTQGKWPTINHWHSTWSHWPMWGHWVGDNGDPPAPAPHHGGSIHWYPVMCTEDYGPWVQAHGVWLPSPNPAGAYWLGLIIHFTALHHLPIPMLANPFIWHACHDISVGHYLLQLCTVDYFILRN